MCDPLCIEGEWITPSNLPLWRRSTNGIAANVADFLEAWYSDADTLPLQTSGSTGKPKIIQAAKQAMRASAELSCKVFGLTPGKRLLLCLPMRYIAGKMLVVRALVSGSELILHEPCSTPLANLHEQVDFVSLVPMQAISTLQQPNGAEQLAKARTILLGGGFIDPALTQALQNHPSRVYASYGMTETLSHIALRRVNGPDASEWYTPLPGVSLSLSLQNTLTLSAPHLNIERMETTDLAEIAADGRFRILGRRDAVINSGGIKIQAEEIEQHIRAATGLTVLAAPAPHFELGQCVALLWEGEPEAKVGLQEAISTLPPYHRPRLIRHLAQLPRTATGKLNRAAAAALLAEAGL